MLWSSAVARSAANILGQVAITKEAFELEGNEVDRSPYVIPFQPDQA